MFLQLKDFSCHPHDFKLSNLCGLVFFLDSENKENSLIN